MLTRKRLLQCFYSGIGRGLGSPAFGLVSDCCNRQKIGYQSLTPLGFYHVIGGPHVSRGELHRRSQCYTTIYELILSGFVSLASMFDARSVLHIPTNYRMRHVEPLILWMFIYTHFTCACISLCLCDLHMRGTHK